MPPISVAGLAALEGGLLQRQIRVDECGMGAVTELDSLGVAARGQTALPGKLIAPGLLCLGPPSEAGGNEGAEGEPREHPRNALRDAG